MTVEHAGRSVRELEKPLGFRQCQHAGDRRADVRLPRPARCRARADMGVISISALEKEALQPPVQAVSGFARKSGFWKVLRKASIR
jgi:hypothetical protein